MSLEFGPLPCILITARISSAEMARVISQVISTLFWSTSWDIRASKTGSGKMDLFGFPVILAEIPEIRFLAFLAFLVARLICRGTASGNATQARGYYTLRARVFDPG